MTWLKNKKNQNLLILAGFFLIVYLIHLGIRTFFGDDLYFAQLASEKGFFQGLIFRFQGWTSRILIEFFLVIVSMFPPLWRIADALMFTLLYWSLSQCVNPRQKPYVNLMLAGLILLIPIVLYNSAGWIATTTNYVWPAAAGAFAFVPVCRWLHGQKNHPLVVALALICTVYACNMEVTCALCLGFAAVILIWLWYSRSLPMKQLLKEPVVRMLLAMILISIAGLLLVLLNTGNANRTIMEADVWMPGFMEFSVFKKLYLGFSSTLYLFCFNGYLPVLIFCFLLALQIKSDQPLYLKAILLFPLAVIFGFYGLVWAAQTFVPIPLAGYLKAVGQLAGPVTKTAIAGLLLALVVIGCILFGLLKVFKKQPAGLLAAVIFLAGIASRTITGFSPTLYASGLRTMYFFYLALIFICCQLFQKLNLRRQNLAGVVLGILVIINMVETVQILMTF